MSPQTQPHTGTIDPALPERLANLAREVDSLKESLEHAQRLATLGTIASLIAHEFNNILTPVMSYAQMALATPHDHQLLIKAVQKAYEGSDRASQIAGAILGFARTDSPDLGGGVAQEPARVAERVDVRAAVQGALACLAREPAKDGIRLEVVVPEGLQARMRPVALQQVLLNLILNARRAMAGNRRGGTLTITARSSGTRPCPAEGAVLAAMSSTWNTRAQSGGGADPGWIELTVKDTGVGMNQDQLSRVFGAFVTGQPSTGGTGLGLTVCQRLVDDAGGAIWCSSQMSVGADFTIAVPIAA